MKYTITTYDDDGNEIISRNFKIQTGIDWLKHADRTVRDILIDSEDSLEDKATRWAEPSEDEDEDEEEEIGEHGEHDCLVDWEDSAGNVNDEGWCNVCGKHDLI